MKYIKLFENFHGEDPKWIVTSALEPIEVDEVPFDEKYGDTSMFRLFELSECPTEDKLNNLKSWLEDEGYYSIIHVHKKYDNNRIIVTDKPIKDVCIEWLNKNYSNLESVESKDYPGCILYRYEPKNNILIHDKENGKVYVGYNLIWSFFEAYFTLDSRVIRSIVESWLSETYNLSGITTKDILALYEHDVSVE